MQETPSPTQAAKDLDLEYVIHNCHTHLFTLDHVPRYFLSRFFPTPWAKNKTLAKIGNLLFKNTINRYAAFFYSALRDNHEDVFDQLQSFYPKSARFVSLSLDFDFMQAGKATYPYLEQLEQLNQLSKKLNKEDKKLFPFVCADPNRPDVTELVKRYITEEGFTGIKLYPALGFFPDDERLFELYAWAEANEIPLISHVIPKNKNHFRYKVPEEWKEKARAGIPGFKEKETRKAYDFAMYLNHPIWWRRVLERFPKLKINLAHFGGNEEWDRYLDTSYDNREYNWYSIIRDILKDYENAYSDISFTVYDRSLYPLLKNLVNTHHKDPKVFKIKEKILFGTDFYMLQKDYRERRFGIDLRGYLSDEEYWLIAERNPKAFLSNRIHGVLK